MKISLNNLRFASLMILGGIALAPLLGERVVFQRVLEGESLIVSEKEVPTPAPTEEQERNFKEAQKKYPGMQRGKIDRTYEYSLVIHPAGKDPMTIWSKLFFLWHDVIAGIQMGFSILDVLHEGGFAALVYKERGWTYGELVPPSAKKSGSGWTGTSKQELARDNRLSLSENTIKSAKIEGSLKGSSVVVNLVYDSGKTNKWSLKDSRWSLVKEAVGKDWKSPEQIWREKEKAAAAEKASRPLDREGTTALMIVAQDASSAHVQEVLAQVLALGADVNATDHAGVTALMYAAQNGNLETVKVLLAHGADIDAKDQQGATALDRAVKAKHDAVAELLRKTGTKKPPAK